MRRSIYPVLGLALLAITHCARAAVAAEVGISSDRILIGAYLPLQGGLAAGASQLRDGADAYFKHVNDQGGIHGRKIEWLVENDSYNPQQTMAIAKKLVDRDGVFALVSTLGTATNLAVLPYLESRKVPLLNPVGVHALLNAPKAPNVFGLLPVGQVLGRSLAEYALTGLSAKRIAIFYQNDQFGKDPRDGAFEYLQKQGTKLVAEASYVPSDVDLSVQVNALKEANPDVVILACITKQGALFVKEAERLGWKPHFVALNTMGDPIAYELAGNALNGLVINVFTAVETMNEPAVVKANEILARYRPETKPGYWSYLGMAGAIVFTEAARRVGPELTRANLIAALEGLGDFKPGVVPPISWSKANHGGTEKIGYAQWQAGKLEIIQGW
ncbi:ABC transporter substrate-binding protein [Bradyrhizobium sp. AUGA SZCCT0182]|uniref:ABC transporter substrate-binding protein n=1 Tax=Bradyrhizobium sp. AUGA SZCCT0182 TaxID=2807667 RepID=UPI001BAA757C|nr:ABC transporter substrate-binding protein [Bradyrhizobium sp. AUGA SZCCT0182]MBR1231615.1 ABC transporter substrate-binding protein [Bradyrhizobium sp. AUGA SZCCT0182]